MFPLHYVNQFMKMQGLISYLRIMDKIRIFVCDSTGNHILEISEFWQSHLG